MMQTTTSHPSTSLVEPFLLVELYFSKGSAFAPRYGARPYAGRAQALPVATRRPSSSGKCPSASTKVWGRRCLLPGNRVSRR
jgi:hypothetical protein